MKYLSHWAHRNPVKTWSLLTILHLMLAYICLAVGIDLFDQGILIPAIVMQLGTGLFLVCMLLYPMRRMKKGLFAHSYARQKIADLLLVVAGMLMITCHGNHTADLPMITPEKEAVATPIVLKEDMVKPNRAERRAFKQEMRSNRKQLRKSIRSHIKALKQQSSTGGQVVLAILTVIGALLLLLLVAALSCGVACGGAGAGALLILLGGLGLVIFLTIIAFRGIFGRRNGG